MSSPYNAIKNKVVAAAAAKANMLARVTRTLSPAEAKTASNAAKAQYNSMSPNERVKALAAAGKKYPEAMALANKSRKARKSRKTRKNHRRG